MGLGLYIVDHICRMHKFKFDYRYKDGYHEFIIWFSKEASSEKGLEKNLMNSWKLLKNFRGWQKNLH